MFAQWHMHAPHPAVRALERGLKEENEEGRGRAAAFPERTWPMCAAGVAELGKRQACFAFLRLP